MAFKMFFLILCLFLQFSQASAKQKLFLTEKNTTQLKTVIHTESVFDTIENLKKCVDETKQVCYLLLDSPGGEVESGLELAQFIAEHKRIELVLVRAYSMAAILAGIVPNKVHATNNAELMFHQVYVRLPTDLKITTALAKRIHAELIDINKTITQKICKKTGMSAEYYERKIELDWYPTTKEAVQLKLVDDIVDTQITL